MTISVWNRAECAWCGTLLRDGVLPVTHGMCHPCFRKALDMPPLVDRTREHHIWCNHFMRPVEGCRMCAGLWERYPYETAEEADGLMARHFPNNVRHDGPPSRNPWPHTDE